MTTLRELGCLFLRLGATSFGGPAAHVAMMHDEVVTRRQWLTEERFLDLVSATNLIPGPNSTELAIHIGWDRSRWAGVIVAGLAFILPAVMMTMCFGWALFQFGTLPAEDLIFYGLRPAVMAIVVQALVRMLPSVLKGVQLRLLAAGAICALAFGVNEIVVLGTTGVLNVLLDERSSDGVARAPSLLALPIGLGAAGATLTTFTLPSLFFVFLKTGAVLFGSGYVLIAFLRADLVHDLGWLSEQELMDAVAVGQITPGPVFTTATFIGYMLSGFEGALVATAGIFLPAFVFVAASAPFVPKLRSSRAAGAFLDGVNACSLALMGVASVQLASVAVIDTATAGIFIASLVVLYKFKVNSGWVALIAVVAGCAAHFIR